jgi:hypothetical protein
MLVFFSRLIRKGAVGAFFCAVLCSLATPERTAAQGWGIDACLTRHVPNDQFLPYQKLLAGAGIRIVRERDVGTRNPDGSYAGDIRPKCRVYHEAGILVVAFAYLPQPVKREQAGDVLPENLLAVYAQGKLLGHDFAGFVDAWEMVGEPDVGYCTDLPERTVAYQKALYLGIKAGAREAGASAPLVLMGALALPPGPWLERAAKNGLLDYTDAYNFHFYGYADELTDVIQAHRAFLANASKFFATRDHIEHTGKTQASSLGSMCSFVANVSDPARLPLWITECGLNAVKPDDFRNAERRKFQADFTVSTAQQALSCPDVAVFMPFILVHNGDPYALTLASDQPLPAWTTYAKFMREHPWSSIRFRPSDVTQGRPPVSESNTLVLQWMPDNSTTLPHKVAGTYRFIGNAPIKGKIFLYNFGDEPVTGKLQMTAVTSVQMTTTRPNVITIAADSRVSVPIEFRQAQPGTYIRGDFSAVFIEDDGRGSPLCFGLESIPALGEFSETPLGLKPLASGTITEPGAKNFRPGDRVGAWTTVNGLQAEVLASPAAISNLRSQISDPKSEGSILNLRSEILNSQHATRFWTPAIEDDPLSPTLAAAKLDGLPSEGFLRLRLDRPMGRETKVRLDLIDDQQQRFTIWENFGVDYYGSKDDLWLNLKDFYIFFWGPCSKNPQFDPARVRELQLRFYFAKANDPLAVTLSLLTPR